MLKKIIISTSLILSADATITTSSNSNSINNQVSNVQIITSAELQDKKISTLVEALSLVSGIDMSSNGGLGQQTSFFLRGLATDTILVLIDGVSYNDPTTIGNQAQIEHIMVNDIAQIEISKGSQGGKFGAGYSGGVINIITKKANKKLTVNLINEHGSFDKSKIYLNLSQKIDKFSYYLGYTHLQSDGITAKADKNNDIEDYENDSYKNNTLNVKLSYDITKNNILDVKYSKIDTNTSYDNSLTSQDGYYITQDNTIINSTFTHKISNNDYVKISAKKTDFKKDDPLGFTKKFYGYNKELNIDAKTSYKNGAVFYGINNSHSEDTEQSKSLDSNGTYISNSIKLFGVDFIQNIRYDQYDAFEDKATGKFGFKKAFNKDISFSVNIAKAYKAPSLYNMYDSWGGNEDLIPQTSANSDISFKYKSSTLTYFTTTIEDEILYSSSTYKYYNQEEISKIKGLEYNYKNNIGSDLLVNFAFTYLDAKDSNDETLAKRADKTAVLAFDYYGIDKLSINLNAKYIGKRVEYAYGTYDISANTGNYTVVNSTINYTKSKDMSLYLKLNNITNKKYQETNGYATMPRNFTLGLNAKF